MAISAVGCIDPRSFSSFACSRKRLGNRRDPAAVRHLGVELGEPGPQPMRHAVGHPHADFFGRLHRILPAPFLLDRGRGDQPDGPVAHGAAHPLAVAAGRPDRDHARAALMVDEQDRAIVFDLVEVEIQHRGIADVGDEAAMRPLAGDHAVPVADEIGEHAARPAEPGLPDGIVRIASRAAVRSRSSALKSVDAMGAIADAMTGPAVGEHRIDIVIGGDLADHLAHEAAIVVAPGAGDVGAGKRPVLPRVRHPP